MKTIIIDDEDHSRKSIAEILQHHCPSISVVAQAGNVKSGLLALKKYKPKLILLDIGLSDGSGFDLLKQIDPSDFKIIFITGHEEYAIKAFKFSAIDYILKPVSSHELVAAIEKAHHIGNSESVDMMYDALMANINSDASHPKKMIIKSLNSYHIITISEITRCIADGNYTQVFFVDGRMMLVSKTLKEFDDLLSDQGFIRIHKSHLINISYIERYEKFKEGNIVLKDKSVIPVSVFKKQALLTMFEKTLRSL